MVRTGQTGLGVSAEVEDDPLFPAKRLVKTNLGGRKGPLDLDT